MIQRGLLLFLISTILLGCVDPESAGSNQLEESVKVPTDWLFRQRAYPRGQIDKSAYKTAVSYREACLNVQLNKSDIRSKTSWVSTGPTNIGGRITDIEMPAENFEIIYAAAASGGIFKTINGGENWFPIFDDQPSLSIGDIALAPSNNDIIYVGTGEANAGGGSLAYDGLGVFKSTDGGNSWESKGLEEIGSVGRIVVHPNDPNIAFVAAMGALFRNNSERGVYRTTDGGDSWEKVLFLSDSTGAVDLAIHPDDPSIVYAAMWERVRRPNYRQYGGSTSGIYRTKDGGNTWEELGGGLPTNPETKGRIGIAISASDPEILYAVYARTSGYLLGIYKSVDGGNNWQFIDRGIIDSPPYMWWFGRIYIDPKDPKKVYVLSLNTFKSTNSGDSWQEIFNGAHVDQHAVFIHPMDPEFILLGNDGGVFKSLDGGASYNKFNNLPITQFYTCEIDYQFPARLYGGSQDNSTMRTLTGNSDDWETIFIGDGFFTRVDPTNNQYIYTEYQYGNFVRSTNGGNSFNFALDGINLNDRFNWNTPFQLDPQTPSTLYLGTNKVYKSTTQADFWVPISPDLSNGPGLNLAYGTLTTLHISPVDPMVIYAGTDDGNVWVTTDAGENWNIVSGQLPDRWVTRVTAHPARAATGYVTFSGYRHGENIGHVYRTNDYGDSWTDITSNLPDVPVNDILINPEDHALYLASDIGVFTSLNDGGSWQILGAGLPNVVVTDLSLHVPTQKLVAATYGRSMFSYQVDLNTTSTQEKIGIRQLKILPNPARNKSRLSISLNTTEDLLVDLIDAQGKQLRTIKTGRLPEGEHDLEIDLIGLSAGIYFVRIRNGKGGLTGHILVIQ